MAQVMAGPGESGARAPVGATPSSLRDFRGRHEGGEIIVCGCGPSLHELRGAQGRITVGVNDVGRLFDPTYLVVVNPRNQFKAERFPFVESSNAQALFTQLDLGRVRPPVVRFKLGRYGGTETERDVLHYTQNSPYVAVCLAAHMGARRIGLIGVDFTEGHFFAQTGRHPLATRLREIDAQYASLFSALRQHGIELVNLSSISRLTSLPRMRIDTDGAWIGAAPPAAAQVRASDSLSKEATVRVAIEKYGAGPVGSLLDTLAATLTGMGHAVARKSQRISHDAGKLAIVWNGRGHSARGLTLFCEHGWLPRSDYQISPRGINADSHIAPFVWDGKPLSADASAALDAHMASIKEAAHSGYLKYMQANASVAQNLPAEFLLVPLQIEFDTNLLRHAPRNLRVMQAVVDHVAAMNPPWPVIFKQHPADARRTNQHLRLRMRRRQDAIWPHARANIHGLLKSPGCRGVITVNSNVAHDGLLWDVPAIVLGRNVWPSSGAVTPFLTEVPKNWSSLQASVTAPEAIECRRAYAHYLFKNQWTLSDVANPARVAQLLEMVSKSALALMPGPGPVRRPVQRAVRPAVRSAVTAIRRPRAARDVGPRVNVVAENRGWLFEGWKRRFAAVTRSGLSVVASDRPVREADAWIFIRAREANRSPDLSRTVVQLHDALDPEAYSPNGERAAVRNCGALSLTHAGQRDLLSSAGIDLTARRVLVQPVGFADEKLERGVLRPVPTVAWLGRPAAHRGGDCARLGWFVDATRTLGKAARVVLAGEGLESAARTIRENGVECAVRARVGGPQDAFARSYDEYDCVAITTASDSGPWPLFDALHAGIPVVSAPVGWGRDLLADGTCGVVADSAEAMRDAIHRIVGERDIWWQKREAIRARVAGFSTDAWVAANLALAGELVAPRVANAEKSLETPASAERPSSSEKPAAVRLDVGCGEKCRDGFLGVDLRRVKGVSVVCNAWEVDRHFAPASVDVIYSRHFFEHLTFEQGKRTLQAFKRVLRHSGSLQLIVPDIRYHAIQFLQREPNAKCEANPRWSNQRHAVAGFWGWQRDGAQELWDVHKSGYDEAMLVRALMEAGFVEMKRLPDHPWNLSVQATVVR